MLADISGSNESPNMTLEDKEAQTHPMQHDVFLQERRNMSNESLYDSPTVVELALKALDAPRPCFVDSSWLAHNQSLPLQSLEATQMELLQPVLLVKPPMVPSQPPPSLQVETPSGAIPSQQDDVSTLANVILYQNDQILDSVLGAPTEEDQKLSMPSFTPPLSSWSLSTSPTPSFSSTPSSSSTSPADFAHTISTYTSDYFQAAHPTSAHSSVPSVTFPLPDLLPSGTNISETTTTFQDTYPAGDDGLTSLGNQGLQTSFVPSDPMPLNSTHPFLAPDPAVQQAHDLYDSCEVRQYLEDMYQLYQLHLLWNASWAEESRNQPCLPLSWYPTTSSRPIVCERPGCHKMFANCYNLNEHRKVHAHPRLKSFVCAHPGCHRRYFYKRDLERHRRKNHPHQTMPYPTIKLRRHA